MLKNPNLSPEIALRAEVRELARALRTRNAELQRMAHTNAEAQRAVATAGAEVQRLADEETFASRAIGLAPQQTALRAGFRGEHSQEAHALYQRECSAVQQLQEASAQQYSAFHGSANRLRSEFSHAERVFCE